MFSDLKQVEEAVVFFKVGHYFISYMSSGQLLIIGWLFCCQYLQTILNWIVNFQINIGSLIVTEHCA